MQHELAAHISLCLRTSTVTILPIETWYKGCRFRSRLEARWAVFFDTAKIRWDYEPQGYIVNGRCYLPDFFLPDLNCYFEVKPTSEYDLEFLQTFANEITKFVVVAEGGIPDPAEWSCPENSQLRVLHCSSPDGEIHPWDDTTLGYKDMFLQCNNCGHISIANEMYCNMKDICGACDKSTARLMPLSDALRAARSARFEYGECG